eukprot:gene25064-biopygen2970
MGLARRAHYSCHLCDCVCHPDGLSPHRGHRVGHPGGVSATPRPQGFLHLPVGRPKSQLFFIGLITVHRTQRTVHNAQTFGPVCDYPSLTCGPVGPAGGGVEGGGKPPSNRMMNPAGLLKPGWQPGSGTAADTPSGPPTGMPQEKEDAWPLHHRTSGVQAMEQMAGLGSLSSWVASTQTASSSQLTWLSRSK